MKVTDLLVFFCVTIALFVIFLPNFAIEYQQTLAGESMRSEDLDMVGMSLDLLQDAWGEPDYCSYAGGTIMMCIWSWSYPYSSRYVMFSIDGLEWRVTKAWQMVKGEHDNSSP